MPGQRRTRWRRRSRSPSPTALPGAGASPRRRRDEQARDTGEPDCRGRAAAAAQPAPRTPRRRRGRRARRPGGSRRARARRPRRRAPRRRAHDRVLPRRRAPEAQIPGRARAPAGSRTGLRAPAAVESLGEGGRERSGGHEPEHAGRDGDDGDRLHGQWQGDDRERREAQCDRRPPQGVTRRPDRPGGRERCEQCEGAQDGGGRADSPRRCDDRGENCEAAEEPIAVQRRSHRPRTRRLRPRRARRA